jgi:serine kinase of HPr protein (carbohydrate metabolism regulator)
MIVHAGLVALRCGGFWRGVLITGPSGAGKSDLALRAIEAGFRLVADDRTVLWISAGKLFGKAPEALFGLIECRGQGVLADCALPFCEIALLAACETPARIQRLPDPRATETLLGLAIPRLPIAALEASAPAKLRRGLLHLG